MGKSTISIGPFSIAMINQGSSKLMLFVEIWVELRGEKWVILVGISRLGNAKVEHVSLVDMILEIVLWNEGKKQVQHCSCLHSNILTIPILNSPLFRPTAGKLRGWKRGRKAAKQASPIRQRGNWVVQAIQNWMFIMEFTTVFDYPQGKWIIRSNKTTRFWLGACAMRRKGLDMIWFQ